MISPALSRRMIIYTDHEPIVFAVESDCARAYAYWELQRTLHSFPVPCSIRHVPGILNPADPFSRGVEVSPDTDAWALLLGDALAHHSIAEHDISIQEDGVYGVLQPEWLLTARNPYRSLFAPLLFGMDDQHVSPPSQTSLTTKYRAGRG